MLPRLDPKRAHLVLTKIDEILSLGEAEGSGAGYQVCRAGEVSMRGAGGTVLEGRETEKP